MAVANREIDTENAAKGEAAMRQALQARARAIGGSTTLKSQRRSLRNAARGVTGLITGLWCSRRAARACLTRKLNKF